MQNVYDAGTRAYHSGVILYMIYSFTCCSVLHVRSYKSVLLYSASYVRLSDFWNNLHLFLSVWHFFWKVPFLKIIVLEDLKFCTFLKIQFKFPVQLSCNFSNVIISQNTRFSKKWQKLNKLINQIFRWGMLVKYKWLYCL